MRQCRNPCAVCKQLFRGSSREAVEQCCVRGEARPGEAQPCAELQLCGSWWHSSGGITGAAPALLGCARGEHCLHGKGCRGLEMSHCVWNDLKIMEEKNRKNAGKHRRLCSGWAFFFQWGTGNPKAGRGAELRGGAALEAGRGGAPRDGGAGPGAFRALAVAAGGGGHGGGGVGRGSGCVGGGGIRACGAAGLRGAGFGAVGRGLRRPAGLQLAVVPLRSAGAAPRAVPPPPRRSAPPAARLLVQVRLSRSAAFLPRAAAPLFRRVPGCGGAEPRSRSAAFAAERAVLRPGASERCGWAGGCAGRRRRRRRGITWRS